MLSKNIIFKQFSPSSKKFNSYLQKNLNKTKNAFRHLEKEIGDNKIPFLQYYVSSCKLAFDIKNIKKLNSFKNIVVIGMGGSILGIKSIASFFKKKIKKNIFFFDNLDSNLHSDFKKLNKLGSICFIIISKSGNTMETIANLNLLSNKFVSSNKIILITEDKNNSLMQIAKKLKAEVIEHRDYIGGRYSVLSEVGMLPSLLMGLKYNNFFKLLDFFKNNKLKLHLIKNVANIYTLYNCGLKTSVLLSYDSNLNDLGYWYQQLVAESLGKKGIGITPFISPSPKDHHSLLQLYLDGPKDKFFTFFMSENSKDYKIPNKYLPDKIKFIKKKSINSLVNAQSEAVQKVFQDKNIPFRKFYFKKKSEEDLGLVFTFYVLETLLISRLMKVNPYNQPAVEKVKIETKKKILR